MKGALFMSLMSSLYMMGSGLRVAQNGLHVTSHNMSNTDTEGYCRQRITQSDSSYRDVGGGMRVGSGVDVEQLQQIRNTFLDISYREEASKKGYHSKVVETVDEIETILGDINGESISGNMRELWDSINSLVPHPEGVETRKAFLDTAVGFIDRANKIHDKLVEYQYNLNGQIKSQVAEINNITKEIAQYNLKIARNEASGDHANDYRDQRNLLLDKLSTYGYIDVSEDKTGQVNVTFEGHTIVNRTDVNTLGLRYLNDATGQSFVEPVWTSDKDILSHTDPATSLYSTNALKNTDSLKKNDNGSLRALLVSRGTASANATLKADGTEAFPYSDVEGFIIPTMQKELDTLITKITGMLNNIVNPKDTALAQKPYDGYQKQGNSGIDIDGDGINDNELIFIPKDLVITTDPTTGKTTATTEKGFTSGNLIVNPKLLDSPTKLAISSNGDPADTTLVQSMLTQWQSSEGEFSPETPAVGKKQNFENFYAESIARLGIIGQKSSSIEINQLEEITKINNQRSSVSSVSLDEEMTNMIIYQHAYNASAKVYNVIDSMLQSVLNMV